MTVWRERDRPALIMFLLRAAFDAVRRWAKQYPLLVGVLRPVRRLVLGEITRIQARGMRAMDRRYDARIGTNARGRQIVMLVVSDLRIDPRVEREARALSGAGYQVHIICPAVPDADPAQIKLDWGPSVTIEFLHWSAASFMDQPPGYFAYQLYREAIKSEPFAIHSHDLSTAYAGVVAAKVTGAHLVADFHEWFSENVHWDYTNSKWAPYPRDWKRLLQKLEAQCLAEASATVTVCDSIADAMATELGGRRPYVIRNIPDLNSVPTREYPPLKQQLGLLEASFVILWQGGTGPTRMIEPIIEALVHAPKCTFVIRGPSLDLYGEGYKELARRSGVEDRLILLPPIPSRDVVAAARGADAGIWTLPPLCRNFTYALPNKIFEYLAADLPVLAAHYPEPARILDQYGTGLTFDPHLPRSIADAINRLIDEPELAARFRANTRTALKGLDAQREWQKLVDIYDGLARAS
jgi:glycosyltransferase involved in cell wall biosynthesis